MFSKFQKYYQNKEYHIKVLYCDLLVSYNTVTMVGTIILKITLYLVKVALLTALRTSSRCPSTPPNIAMQTSVLMFHSLKAWSFDTDNNKFGSRGWNLSSFIA